MFFFCLAALHPQKRRETCGLAKPYDFVKAAFGARTGRFFENVLVLGSMFFWGVPIDSMK